MRHNYGYDRASWLPYVSYFSFIHICAGKHHPDTVHPSSPEITLPVSIYSIKTSVWAKQMSHPYSTKHGVVPVFILVRVVTDSVLLHPHRGHNVMVQNRLSQCEYLMVKKNEPKTFPHNEPLYWANAEFRFYILALKLRRQCAFSNSISSCSYNLFCLAVLSLL